MAKYSLIFKLKVVTAYLNGDGGYEYLTKKYGVKTTSQVRRWISAFKEFGKDSLCRICRGPKGRIPTMSRTDEKAKISTHTKSRNQKKKKELTPEQARILELEKQLRYAQIENAYLKELRRLRLEDARKMKEQQESLAVSEENSN